MSDASDEDRSIRQLEREAERNRAELVSTVEELRERVSPSQVKEDVKEYATRSGQHFVVNIVEKARENPIQAAAVAALVGYPLWGLIRSIPVPVMLLGAGALLAGRLTGDSGQSSSSSGWQGGRGSYDYESGRMGYGSDYGQSGGYGYGGAQSGYGYGTGGTGSSYEGEFQSYSMQSEGMQGVIERNPMLVTGLGLLVGALLGGSLAASGAFQGSRDESY